MIADQLSTALEESGARMRTASGIVQLTRGPTGKSRVLQLKTKALLPLRQKGNPIESDRCGDVDGKRVCGDDFEYYEALMDSIRRHGMKAPIEIAWWGRKPEIAEGHHRLSAAWELNLERVPCLVDSTVTDDTLRAIGALDGHVSESALEEGRGLQWFSKAKRGNDDGYRPKKASLRDRFFVSKGTRGWTVEDAKDDDDAWFLALDEVAQWIEDVSGESMD